MRLKNHSFFFLSHHSQWTNCERGTTHSLPIKDPSLSIQSSPSCVRWSLACLNFSTWLEPILSQLPISFHWASSVHDRATYLCAVIVCSNVITASEDEDEGDDFLGAEDFSRKKVTLEKSKSARATEVSFSFLLLIIIVIALLIFL